MQAVSRGLNRDSLKSLNISRFSGLEPSLPTENQFPIYLEYSLMNERINGGWEVPCTAEL